MTELTSDPLSIVSIFGTKPADEGVQRDAWETSVGAFVKLARIFTDLPDDDDAQSDNRKN